jgi:uncharacterized caspase-like protein
MPRGLCAVAVAALALATPGPAAAQARVALVVGNAAYAHAAALPNTVNDARDIGAALRELGFTVVLGLDLGKRAFEDTLRSFANRIAAADVALVFYAGHGLQVAGQNHLAPIDAKLESERDLPFETVRLDILLQLIQYGREGKAGLVFLDACRDNPLTRNLARSMGTRSATLAPGLAPAHSLAGTFIAFSTEPGNVARDGRGRNSPFAAALLRHMRTPGRPLAAVMIEVRRDVMAATAGRQVPWDHSALTGEFYFRAWPGAATGSLPPGPPAAEPAQHEERTRRLQEELGRHPPPLRP